MKSVKTIATIAFFSFFTLGAFAQKEQPTPVKKELTPAQQIKVKRGQQKVRIMRTAMMAQKVLKDSKKQYKVIQKQFEKEVKAKKLSANGGLLKERAIKDTGVKIEALEESLKKYEALMKSIKD